VNLASVKPLKGIYRLEPGKRYTVTAPIQVPGGETRRYVADGPCTIDATALVKNQQVWHVTGGTLEVRGPITVTIPNHVFGVSIRKGGVVIDGGGQQRITFTGGGQIVEALTCQSLLLNRWRYVGRPKKYVAFLGDPMQTSNPKWGLDGVARNVLVQDGEALEASHDEALIRAMFAYGSIVRVKLDNSKQQSPGVHKQALQLRGSHLYVEDCDIAASIAVGPLDAAKELDPYRKVAGVLPHAWVTIARSRIAGYIEVSSDTSCAIRDCEITGADPRAAGRGECITRKRNTGREMPTVVVSGTKMRGKPFASLHGSGVLGHDRKLLMDIFAKSVSQR